MSELSEAEIDFRIGMMAGSRLLREAIEWAERGKGVAPHSPDFIWNGKEISSVANPNSGSSKRQIEVCDRIRKLDAVADGLRVSRDPCPRCGIRGDISCGCAAKARCA